MGRKKKGGGEDKRNAKPTGKNKEEREMEEAQCQKKQLLIAVR